MTRPVKSSASWFLAGRAAQAKAMGRCTLSCVESAGARRWRRRRRRRSAPGSIPCVSGSWAGAKTTRSQVAWATPDTRLWRALGAQTPGRAGCGLCGLYRPRRLWRLRSRRRERLKQQVAVDLHPPPLFMWELSFSAQPYPWFCSALALTQVSPGVLVLLSPAWFHVNQDSRGG